MMKRCERTVRKARATWLAKTGLLAFVGVAAIALCGAGGGRAAAAQRPNVVLIMTDQQFADAMSCRMGHRYIDTPTMDSLAKTGLLFTRAYSANPLCMPARNSIFTGHYPHQTGITQNAGPMLDSKRHVCLGNYFRHAGYMTAYFGKWHLRFPKKDTKKHGFQTTECLHGNGHDGEVADLAAAYLAKQRGQLERPFLAVVSLSNPHDVCQLARHQRLPSGPVGAPPAPDQCPPAPANLAPPVDETDTMTVLRKGYQGPGSKFPVGRYTDDDWRQLRWGYYRLIEKVDAEIGKVIRSVHEAGRDRDTVVIFTSDHGECAGAHRFNQKTVFYEESARIPLIIRFPDRIPPATCDLLVNTGIDLLPTLLDFAAIPLPEGLPGRSLRGIALGEMPSKWRDHIVVENHMNQTVKVGGLRASAQGRMVRSQRYKYCVYTRGLRRESLFDLQEDPLETKNLAGDAEYRSVVLQHRKLLAEFGRDHDDPLVAELLSDDVGPKPFSARQKPRR